MKTVNTMTKEQYDDALLDLEASFIPVLVTETCDAEIPYVADIVEDGEEYTDIVFVPSGVYCCSAEELDSKIRAAAIYAAK